MLTRLATERLVPAPACATAVAVNVDAMRLATWNVNSVRSRVGRVVDWLGREDVDVLAMQEIKCTEAQFPAQPFEDAGYEVVMHGLNQWNGVAIVSRLPISDVQIGFDGQPGFDKTGADDAPIEARAVTREALVRSAIYSAERAEEMGLSRDRIILSAKVSAVQDLIACYKMLAARTNHALHLGLTEAGMGSKGIVASSAAMGILLQQGIGDTIRISLTPEPGGARTGEVVVGQEILQTMGLRSFTPMVIACPGCGRTTSTLFQELASQIQTYLRNEMPVWRDQYPGVEKMHVAVMGCIVNGPGESKHANIGISLPGSGENPAAPVFVDGVKVKTLRGEHIAQEFQQIVSDYVARTYGRREEAAAASL